MKVVRWQTPWPMIQISDLEWVIMRDHPARPAALVRYIDKKRDESYRVVRWAPRSADRRLFEYFPSLEMADMAVTVVVGIDSDLNVEGELQELRARIQTVCRSSLDEPVTIVDRTLDSGIVVTK